MRKLNLPKFAQRILALSLAIGFGVAASSVIWKYQQSAGENLAVSSARPIPTLQISGAAPANTEIHNTTFIYRDNPQRAPLAPGPRLSFPLREAWRSEELNVGAHTASKSSAAVDASGIYVGSDAGEFRAYDLDGKLRWKFAILQNKQGFHGTALLDEKYAYIGAYNGRFYKFDKASGKVLWATRLADAVGTAPVRLSDGDLIVSAEKSYRDGYLLRLNSQTGAVLWRTVGFLEQVHSSPTISPDERMAYVGDNRGIFHGVSLETGALRWGTDLGGAIKGTAALQNGVLYVNSWGKGITQASPIPLGDVVFTSGQRPSVLRGVDQKTGAEIWSRLVSDGREGMASALLVSDGKKRDLALIQCKPETLCAIEIRTGKVRYEHPVPGRITSLPTFAEGRIYLTFDRGPMLVLESAPESAKRAKP
ncbi:MAG: hypothetical protein EOP11_08495 [Proteobacteria bacterium]|nr:MAG: hypothetical protein EOP11_08495 [Pseudomonadota bacterium]